MCTYMGGERGSIQKKGGRGNKRECSCLTPTGAFWAAECDASPTRPALPGAGYQEGQAKESGWAMSGPGRREGGPESQANSWLAPSACERPNAVVARLCARDVSDAAAERASEAGARAGGARF